MKSAYERTKLWRKEHPKHNQAMKNAWQRKNKKKQHVYNQRWYRRHMGKPKSQLKSGHDISKARARYYKQNMQYHFRHHDKLTKAMSRYNKTHQNELEYHRAIRLIAQSSKKECKKIAAELVPLIKKRVDVSRPIRATTPVISSAMRKPLAKSSIRNYSWSARHLVRKTGNQQELIALYKLIQKKLKKI